MNKKGVVKVYIVWKLIRQKKDGNDYKVHIYILHGPVFPVTQCRTQLDVLSLNLRTCSVSSSSGGF